MVLLMLYSLCSERETQFYWIWLKKYRRKVLTWGTRWSGTSASGLWRWQRTVRGNCAWSSRSRASRTPLMDTRTWIHRRDDSHIRHRSCTRRVYICLMMHLPHSAHLLERKDKLSSFPISFMESTAYFCMKLKPSPLNIVSLHSYLLNEVIATSQFIILSLLWKDFNPRRTEI